MVAYIVLSMCGGGLRKLTWLFLATGFLSSEAVGQHVGLRTEEIESVIREWNYANNSRSMESFRNVYQDTLLFYTQTLPSSKAIALKQELFSQKPWFRQRVITGVSYSPYTSGVIKCDFIKEVMEKRGWKTYPSYLLVSYREGRYRIVGESDYATDNTLRYKLNLGEPMTFQNVAEVPDPFYSDSARSAATAEESSAFFAQGDYGMSALDSLLKPVDLISFFPQLSSMGVITIRKGYIFLLIGFLAVGGIMIVIADSLRAPKRKRRKILVKHDKAERIVRDLNTQSIFEAFVITLFDPLYFRHRRPKAERIYAGKVVQGETGSDLEFEFTHGETHASFAVKCIYIGNALKSEVQLFRPIGGQEGFTASDDSEMPLYFILGFGGTPDDPKEFYLVPATAVRHGGISKSALRQYSKSGMFFYNRVAGKLQ